MGFTCFRSLSYAELLLAVASYLLFRREGGILWYISRQEKRSSIFPKIFLIPQHTLPFQHGTLQMHSVHEFVFWHKIFLLFDKVSLLPCLVQLTQCRLHLFFFFFFGASCLRDPASNSVFEVSAPLSKKGKVQHDVTKFCLRKKDLLLPFRCTLKSSASPHYIAGVWSTIGGLMVYISVTSRMVAWGDTWQVHDCGSSNWATGDISEWPKPAAAAGKTCW